MKWVSAIAAIVSLFLAAAPANATIRVVNVGNNFFNPINLTVNPGDTVRWTRIAGVHTSTSTGASTKDWNSGIIGSTPFDVQFVLADGPGPFPYLCSVHGVSMSGSISINIPPPCCVGNRGDINDDGNDATILDLNYLVNDIFRGGPPSPCPEEADLNNDSSPSTILDLNFLVNDIFRGGPSAPACP